MEKAVSRGVHCIPFENIVWCLKAVQVHFSLQTEDSLLLLLLTARHRPKVEEERIDGFFASLSVRHFLRVHFEP